MRGWGQSSAPRKRSRESPRRLFETTYPKQRVRVLNGPSGFCPSLWYGQPSGGLVITQSLQGDQEPQRHTPSGQREGGRALGELEQLASKVFGFASLRQAQREALQLILDNDRALVTLPTGSGKSLLYGLTALCEPGTTLVVSPLTALKREQAALLRAIGVPAAHLSFDQSREEREAIWQLIGSGGLKLLFVSPERFTSHTFAARWQKLFRDTPGLARVFIDEAHCMASWGYDFRPEYRRIGASIRSLGVERVVALTATASPRTRQLICQILHPMTAVMQASPLGSHVHVAAHRVAGEAQREAWLEARLRSLRAPSKLIVYVQRRADAERLTAAFRALPVRTVCYHAGLAPQSRAEIERYIQQHPGPLAIFATQAFGMGINLPEVDEVVVSGYPSGIEEFIQMLGRAGRKGTAARGTLLWTGSDPIKRLYGIERGLPLASHLGHVLREWQRAFSGPGGGAFPEALDGGIVRLKESALARFLRESQAQGLRAEPERARSRPIRQQRRKGSTDSGASEPSEGPWSLESFVSVLRLAEVFFDLVPGEPLVALGAASQADLATALETLGSGDSQRKRVLAFAVATGHGAEAARPRQLATAEPGKRPFFTCLPLHDVVAETRLGVSQLERVVQSLSQDLKLAAALMVPSQEPEVGEATGSWPGREREYVVAPFALRVEETVLRYREVRDERLRGFDALDQFARAQGCRMRGVLRYFDRPVPGPCGQCDFCDKLPRLAQNAPCPSKQRNPDGAALDGS